LAAFSPQRLQYEYPNHQTVTMSKQTVSTIFSASIAALAGIFLFSGWAMAEQTVHATARYADQSELDEVRRDLEKIDGYASEGIYGSASVIVGRDIRARDVYRAYLDKAARISSDLLAVRPKLASQNETLTLQQLGALAQRLTVENAQFRDDFQHGENRFQTYRLIETAITSFEDAIHYWRLSNHFRKTYRGSARERAEDDEVLKFKLQKAMNAIDELKSILETREKLKQDLEEE
jgi:hypothetical protein